MKECVCCCCGCSENVIKNWHVFTKWKIPEAKNQQKYGFFPDTIEIRYIHSISICIHSLCSSWAQVSIYQTVLIEIESRHFNGSKFTNAHTIGLKGCEKVENKKLKIKLNDDKTNKKYRDRVLANPISIKAIAPHAHYCTVYTSF